MARRLAWDQLSDNYRQRLTRKGITPEQHAQGASLKGARGHGTPTGIGEKSYSNLLKLARARTYYVSLGGSRTLTASDIKEIVDSELLKGVSPRWLRARLQQREKDVDSYRNAGNRGPGNDHYQRRRQTVAIELYWYH